MTANTSTVVGVFKDYSSAEKAARDLNDNGIQRDAIHIQSASRSTTAGHSEYAIDEREGGIAGFFRNLFGNDDSERYSTVVENGRTVLTADVTSNQSERAAELLNLHGAIDVDRDQDSHPGSTAGTSSVPVVNEELRVGKRSVQRGGVRVYSHVVERPVEKQVTLREERVTVERRPVDRAIATAELSGLRDQSFEMMETVEEPVIEKRARVTEEVVIGKETTQRTQKVSDTVRHTDVTVERIGGTNKTDYEEDFRDDWQRNYASLGGDYASYQPAYQYGYRFAADPRYKGRAWSEVEPELRNGFERDNPGRGAWERMKGAVRHGWDKVTGQR